MSVTKKIVVVIVILLAVFALYYFYKKSQNVPIRFLDNGHSGTLQGDAGAGGWLGFVIRKGEKSGLKAGDKVLIVQDSGFKYKDYDGETIVKEVTMGGGSFRDNEIVVTEKGYIGSSPVNPGYITKLNVF